MPDGERTGAKRGDSLDRIIYMLLGPLRHRFTALERAKEQGIGHYFVPRYTRVVDTAESKDNINKAYNLISTSKVRNEMIIDDAITCVARKQTPVILTRFKDIMSANINALLDKCEDPEKMIDQYMRNLESDLGKVKAETASVMAEETRAKRELDECTEQVNSFLKRSSSWYLHRQHYSSLMKRQQPMRQRCARCMISL